MYVGYVFMSINVTNDGLLRLSAVTWNGLFVVSVMDRYNVTEMYGRL